jgi:hypothetical protein
MLQVTCNLHTYFPVSYFHGFVYTINHDTLEVYQY